MNRLVRSVLYSPADRIKILQKAIILKPDVIVIDLEDAVSPTKKLFARDNILDFINSLLINSNNDNNITSSLTIRINCPVTSAFGKDDLDFISKLKQTDKVKVNAIIIPKVDDINTINCTVDIMNKNGMNNINLWYLYLFIYLSIYLTNFINLLSIYQGQ
jgi:citrate lyase beta subunit